MIPSASADRRLHVGIDASSLITRHPRGEGRSLLRLYREIARLRPSWQFTFFGRQVTPSVDVLKRSVPGCKVVVVDPPGFRWSTWERFALPLLAWRAQTDVLHCASSGSPDWSPVPVVMTVHDLIPILLDDGVPPSVRDGFERRLRAGARVAREVICVSEHTRRDLLRVIPGIASHPIVVRWGADVAPLHASTPFSPIRERAPVVLGLGGGGAKRKNLPMLVRSFARAAGRIPAARLCIVGVNQDAQRSELIALGRASGVEHSLEVRGFVDDVDLDALFGSARCVAYLSLYEGFGLPPLEAMARGVPVVASVRSSIPEVVGDAGLLVDPENAEAISEAFVRLLADPEFAQHLGSLGKLRAESFRWEETGECVALALERAAGVTRRFWRRGGT